MSMTSRGIFGQEYDPASQYPLDHYSVVTSIQILDHTNASAYLPVVRIAAAGITNTFWPHNYGQRRLANYVDAAGDIHALPAWEAYILLRRTPVVSAFVIMLLSVNWGLTLMTLYITVAAFASNGVTLGEGVLILPVTVILTIPALRSLFVDAPPLTGE